MKRPRLRTLPLTGARSTIRSWGFIVLAAAAAVAALGYVLPAHHLDNAVGFHPNFADGGVLPLVVAAFVIGAQLVLRRYRLGAGIAAGVLGAGGAIGAVAPVVLAHFLETVQTTYGEDLFFVGVLGMFFAGIALAVAEPMLYVLERRSVERAAQPAPLPVAIGTFIS